MLNYVDVHLQFKIYRVRTHPGKYWNLLIRISGLDYILEFRQRFNTPIFLVPFSIIFIFVMLFKCCQLIIIVIFGTPHK